MASQQDPSGRIRQPILRASSTSTQRPNEQTAWTIVRMPRRVFRSDVRLAQAQPPGSRSGPRGRSARSDRSPQTGRPGSRRPDIATVAPAQRAAVRRPWEPCVRDGATQAPVPRDPGAAAAARQSTAKRLRSRSLRSSAPGRAARRRRTFVSAPRSSGSMPAKTSSRSSMPALAARAGKQGSVRNLGDAAGLSGPAGGRCRAGRAAR